MLRKGVVLIIIGLFLGISLTQGINGKILTKLNNSDSIDEYNNVNDNNLLINPLSTNMVLLGISYKLTIYGECYLSYRDWGSDKFYTNLYLTCHDHATMIMNPLIRSSTTMNFPEKLLLSNVIFFGEINLEPGSNPMGGYIEGTALIVGMEW